MVTPSRAAGVVNCPYACLYTEHRVTYSAMTRALDRLKAALPMEPQRKVVKLPDGDFEFWMRPLTLAQRAKAQKLAGGDDATAFALQLLVMVARDEDGQPLFVPGELAELRNAIPAKVVDDLMLAMLDAQPKDEEEAEEDLDPKLSGKPSRKTMS